MIRLWRYYRIRKFNHLIHAGTITHYTLRTCQNRKALEQQLCLLIHCGWIAMFRFCEFHSGKLFFFSTKCIFHYWKPMRLSVCLVCTSVCWSCLLIIWPTVTARVWYVNLNTINTIKNIHLLFVPCFIRVIAQRTQKYARYFYSKQHCGNLLSIHH